ncbi:MAG TPA: hypothetical protein VFF77_03550, partial [Holophagaceae bacterium]|nr:hypothetical protein [Holophagaceae bacterium]
LTRKLSRGIFHKMMRFQAKLERKQVTLFRAVDIGADIFAMVSAVIHADNLKKAGASNAADAALLADLFCRNTERRIRRAFKALGSNDDNLKVKVSRAVLDGRFKWMESELLASPEIDKLDAADHA